LLEECDLQAVLDLPGGAFTGTGVKTVVLFFEKGDATQKVWYYQLNLPRNLGKTNSLNERDLEEFVTLSKTQGESENSWCVNVFDIDKTSWDLTAKNPNKKDESDKRTPNQILAEIEELDMEASQAIAAIKELL
jgi:type I restriction enzyme M protein